MTDGRSEMDTVTHKVLNDDRQSTQWLANTIFFCIFYHCLGGRVGGHEVRTSADLCSIAPGNRMIMPLVKIVKIGFIENVAASP